MVMDWDGAQTGWQGAGFPGREGPPLLRIPCGQGREIKPDSQSRSGMSVSPRALTSRGESLIRDAISVNKSVTTHLFTVENLNIFYDATVLLKNGHRLSQRHS